MNEPSALSMVYCRGKLAYNVEQRRTGTHTWDLRLVTQDMTAPAGVLALSAHGRQDFHSLEVGDIVTAIPKHGPAQHYKVAARLRYQALDNPERYIDLADYGPKSPDEVKSLIYTPDRMIFLTCIGTPGNPAWGRSYVVCERTN
jgi:hypothetical protein